MRGLLRAGGEAVKSLNNHHYLAFSSLSCSVDWVTNKLSRGIITKVPLKFTRIVIVLGNHGRFVVLLSVTHNYCQWQTLVSLRGDFTSSVVRIIDQLKQTHKCCGLFKQYLLTSSSVRGYVGFIHGDGAVCVKINYLSSFGLFLLLCNIVASPALLHFFFFRNWIYCTCFYFYFSLPPLFYRPFTYHYLHHVSTFVHFYLK